MENTLLNDLSNWTIKHRRYLHEHPELSGEEYETCKYIKNELRALNVELLPFNEPNIVGIIRKATSEKTILLRADIDALPIVEEGEHKPYISKNHGVSHACGHDGHTAVLLAVTKWLMENREAVAYNVVVVFQSSEEMAPSGAEQLVKEGVLEQVDAVFGLHLMSSIEKGVIGVTPGPVMASSDDFDITINGRGGHGASPHETVDPTYIAGHLILALQSIIGRKLDPIQPAVISVGQITAEANYNVIPNEVYMNGTFRTFSNETRAFITEELERLTTSLCATFGATADIKITFGTPTVVNDALVTKQTAAILTETMTPHQVKEIPPSLGAEDFSFYLQEKPGCYLFVGMKGEKSQYPHHHPKFDLDEEELATAVKVFTSILENYKL